MRHLRLLAIAICLAAFFPAAQPQQPGRATSISVVDEVGAPVAAAQITIRPPGSQPLSAVTDFAGKGSYILPSDAPYQLQVTKPGFYQQLVDQQNPEVRDIRIILNHEQVVSTNVSVSTSVPGINPEQVSDNRTMNVPEITNVPYPTSRDIRNLLPFYPGIVQDGTGQVHVVGSEAWATLYLLDGFDIRSPVSGNLALRVSADAIRSIDQQSTRYPVEFGRNTGGVIALYTGMGDNQFRFNTTNFVPSLQQKNGIRFDKFVPRFTFSGPLVRDRAWFFDALDLEYDNIYIPELPSNADTNHVLRGSNLLKLQANVTPSSIVSAGLLTNAYHSLYDGLSSLNPRQSTTKRNTIAWMPYLRDQWSFKSGALFDAGIAFLSIRDGFVPHPDGPFRITPEIYLGSYFQALTGRSQRVQGNAALYLPPQHWQGQHNIKLGIDIDRVVYSEHQFLAPINYLREDGTLLRQSTFPSTTPSVLHNVETGIYLQDHWTLPSKLIIAPGLRFDWDQLVRRPVLSPRIAATWSPAALSSNTKLSAGIGLYYDHTQLEYLTRPFTGARIDQTFAPGGLTPDGPPLTTQFLADSHSLRQPRALNWSVGLEQKLPTAIYLRAEFLRKRIKDQFAYVNETAPGAYRLTSTRQDHDNLFEVDARRTFAHGYTLFGAYTHSTAHTNAAIDYAPTISDFGPQQSGPLPWDVPNRILSWGWLPFDVPWFRKSWDFVYTADWHTGVPYTAINANQQVVGVAGQRRFPNFTSISPGLEWRFHFRGSYFGLRGVLENATSSRNPSVVNRVIDSPQFGAFSEFDGRTFTARIRLINSGK
ncbi:TonB-dependent receptor [Occallatibacter savannae]|uniref:TonB-dependent receptor n=1 Tax=Occallatibacter savannae TaxID=1002691 RepID=UPI000D691FB6|nr:TonB-dependent receptor [Occallatibacter savannae]